MKPKNVTAVPLDVLCIEVELSGRLFALVDHCQ